MAQKQEWTPEWNTMVCNAMQPAHVTSDYLETINGMNNETKIQIQKPMSYVTIKVDDDDDDNDNDNNETNNDTKNTKKRSRETQKPIKKQRHTKQQQTNNKETNNKQTIKKERAPKKDPIDPLELRALLKPMGISVVNRTYYLENLLPNLLGDEEEAYIVREKRDGRTKGPGELKVFHDGSLAYEFDIPVPGTTLKNARLVLISKRTEHKYPTLNSMGNAYNLAVGNTGGKPGKHFFFGEKWAENPDYHDYANLIGEPSVVNVVSNNNHSETNDSDNEEQELE